MVIVYDVIFLVFAILYLPYVIFRGKWHGGFWARFGFLPRAAVAFSRERNCIWIHAVSVGEVLAVKRLVDELQTRHPQTGIVISTVTQTGNQLAKEQFPSASVIYAPFDFSLSVRAYLKVIQPLIYITVETEIWPNMFYALYRRGVPLIQVNGRISDASFKTYKRLRRFLKPVLSCVRCFCVQTETDAARMMEIGAIPERVIVTGNMKCDNEPGRGNGDYGPVFQNSRAPVVVAGSTHPGEEEILLDIFQGIQGDFPGLGLILAPRHVERAEEIAGMITRRGMSFRRFSDILSAKVRTDGIVLVDTVGHLRYLYRYASVVFVGKSLCGHGGQNLIEPAALGKPVIVGPHMENFRSVLDLMVQRQAVVVVQDAAQLREEIVALLLDPARAAALGSGARAALEEQRGAVERTLVQVEKFHRMMSF